MPHTFAKVSKDKDCYGQAMLIELPTEVFFHPFLWRRINGFPSTKEMVLYIRSKFTVLHNIKYLKTKMSLVLNSVILSQLKGLAANFEIGLVAS